MCDFFSAVIRRDGAIAHVHKNSHSGAVKAAGWVENDQMADMRGQPRFYEFEWSSEGNVPKNIASILRGANPPEKVIEAATVLAKNLKRCLEEPGWGLLDDGPFAGEEYADLRFRALANGIGDTRIQARLAVMTLHAQGEVIKSLHPLVAIIAGNFSVAEGYQITAPALTEVTGSVYVQANATFTAPALKKGKKSKS